MIPQKVTNHIFLSCDRSHILEMRMVSKHIPSNRVWNLKMRTFLDI